MSPWPIWGLDYFFIKFVIIEKCKSFATSRVKQAVEVKAFSLPAADWAPTLFWGKGNIVRENKQETEILQGLYEADPTPLPTLLVLLVN